MTHKILIIEDDQVLNDMYTLKFKKEHFQVEQAFDGLDGLSKVPFFQPDIILLDLMMPAMNGFETLASIKAQTSSNCKIVVFTNVVDKEKIDEAMELGADEYLIKANTTPKDAIAKVNELLGEKQEDEMLYVQPGINHFKMKNPEGGKDIDIKINITL